MGSFHIALLCVGDELLDGRVSDRNARYLGGFATERGWTVDEVRTVPDTIDAIDAAIGDLCRDGRPLVISGGLGPTSDDLTRDAVASAAGVDLEDDAETAARIAARFAAMGREMSASNLRQARFPRGARIHPSGVGTADPFSMRVAGSTVLCLPGVPFEFTTLLDRLAPTLAPETAPRPQRSLHVFGLAESLVGETIERVDTAGIDVAYTARFPYVTVTLRGGDDDAIAMAARAAADALGPWLVPAGAESLPAALAAIARERKFTIATAESCTGGAIASAITDRPGSSAWFERGWVTYANAAKIDELGVGADVLAAHGAVSPQVARAMATGALARSGADVAVAVSGIAGPDGGTPDRPVGLVYLGVATPDGGVVVRALFRGIARAGFKRVTTALAIRAVIGVIEGDVLAPTAFRGVEWVRAFEEVPA